MLRLILEMRRVAQDRGGSLLVAFPNGLNYALRPVLQQRLHESLAAEGLWCVEMRQESVRRKLTPSELALDDVGHLTPRGHSVAADILERLVGTRFPSAVP